jgi:peptidyl-prolyl cis-trans isomerase SurA
MNRTLLSCSVLGLVLLTLACSGSKNTSSTLSTPEGTVGIVGDQFISYSDLRDNYVSGSIDKSFTEDDLLEFLPIYLDYRGKILDAEANGYYDDDRITNEYQLYSKQAAYAFWMEEEIRPTKFKEFKERYSFELKSKHVLIAVQPNASPEDTLDAFTRIQNARTEFLEGTSMEQLDVKYSTKRNGRSMGGDLPWFSVGTTVPAFENALYALEIGEISKPIRTQFGYHIIYLEDKRERKPERQLSHIFVRRNSDSNKINQAYDSLANGSAWSDIVSRFSEDTPSIPNEGFIGWVNYGSRYDAAFIDSVMNIDVNLPFTEPISTAYGYHIFRIDSVRSFESIEAEDEFIMGLLEDSNTFQENNGFVIDYLINKYEGIKFNDNILAYREYARSLDTLRIDEISIPDSISSLPSFHLNKIEYSIADFQTYINESYASQNNFQLSTRWFDRFVEAMVDERLVDITLDAYPQFEDQTRKYQDGLVVYQVNEDSVWSTATIDTTILRNIYSDSLHKYRYDDRFYYYMITSSRDTSLDKAIEFINEGNSPDSLFSRGIRVGVTSDSTGIFQGEPFTLLSDMQPGDISERFNYSNRKGHFLLIDILPARNMTFEEAFNRLASEYQPEREQKWLERIRETFNIQSFPEVVSEQYLIDQNIE